MFKNKSCTNQKLMQHFSKKLSLFERTSTVALIEPLQLICHFIDSFPAHLHPRATSGPAVGLARGRPPPPPTSTFPLFTTQPAENSCRSRVPLGKESLARRKCVEVRCYVGKGCAHMCTVLVSLARATAGLQTSTSGSVAGKPL